MVAWIGYWRILSWSFILLAARNELHQFTYCPCRWRYMLMKSSQLSFLSFLYPNDTSWCCEITTIVENPQFSRFVLYLSMFPNAVLDRSLRVFGSIYVSTLMIFCVLHHIGHTRNIQFLYVHFTACAREWRGDDDGDSNYSNDWFRSTITSNLDKYGMSSENRVCPYLKYISR